MGRGRWAFLFSDIEGSTRLLLRLGDAFDRCLADHRRIVRAVMAEHGGREDGTEGDSFLVVFDDSVTATKAAVDTQRALVAHKWPVDGAVRIRIGIHEGEGRHDAALGYRGMAIHIAARVMNAGHGGQILVTQPVRLDDRQISTKSLGSFRLKDLPEPLVLHQVVAPGLQPDFPPLRATLAARQALRPRYATPLRGRDALVERIASRLARPGLVTLTGPPGTGKTRLAVEATSTVDPTAAQTTYVDLATTEAGDGVVARIAEVLQLQPDADPLESIARAIGAAQATVVLDNCEHVVRAVAACARYLVDSCPSLTVVATSREAIGTDDEELVAVPPLTIDVGDGPSPALELFVDRARALGVELDGESLAAAEGIVRRLDGIPLAIELAAGLTPVLTPGEIAARLQSRFRLLAGGDERTRDRHRTMLAAVAWGYDLLAEDEQCTLRALSVCPGWFDLELAEALVGDDPATTLHHLRALVRTSWLIRQAEGGRSTYRLLETLRVFAEEQASVDELEQLRHRHAEHVFARASVIGDRLTTDEDAAARGDLDRLAADLLVAFSWSSSRGIAVEAAARTYVALVRYWQTRPDWTEHHRVLTGLLAASDRHDIGPALTSELLAMQSFSLLLAGDVEGAETAALRSVELATEANEAVVLARATRMAGMVLRNSDPVAAGAHLDIAVQISRTHGFDAFVAMAYLDRSKIRSQMDGLLPAIDDARECIVAALRHGDRVSELFGRAQLAEYLESGGEGAAAMEELTSAIELVEYTNHQMARLFFPLDLIRLTGTPEEFRSAAQLAAEGATRLGSRMAQVDGLTVAGLATLACGDAAGAAAHLRQVDEHGGHGQAGPNPVELLRLGVARAIGDPLLASALAGAMRRQQVHERRGSMTSALWLATTWDLIHDPLIDARAREVLVSATSVFGLPWEAVLVAGTDRPAITLTSPEQLPRGTFERVVEEVARALTRPSDGGGPE